MATIIEKVIAGEDGKASQEEFAQATLDRDTVSPSKEFIEAREAQAAAEAEMNLKTNALIYPAAGETVAYRVVHVSDEEAAELEGGSRVADAASFADAIVATQEDAAAAVQPTEVLAEGEAEDTVDAPKSAMPKSAMPDGTAQTSHLEGSQTPGSGVGNLSRHNPDTSDHRF